jgi:VCBS repeat protein/HYDIN/CFA65/VesB family protein/ASPM-SPD-2-Hydin domain-containing protein
MEGLDLLRFRRGASWVSVSCLLAFIVSAQAQFETRGTTPLQPGSEPYAVAVGDFNHDGKLDAVLSDFAKSQAAVLLGNGNGTFQTPVYYSVGFEPRSVAVADLNRDGNLDLAVSGDITSTGIISILLGNGDGTFRSAPDAVLDAFPIFVTVGDFNGDHIPDLVVSDSPYVSVLLGNGDGTFQSPINNQLFSPTYPKSLGIGDFNRDGKLDLVVTGQHGTSSEAKILLGNGDGTFQLGASYDIGSGGVSVAVADFRGIGILDLAIACGNGVNVLLGNGDGTFQGPAVYGSPDQPNWVIVGDFNRDGRLDLAITGGLYNRNVVGVLLGNGDGTFQSVQNYSLGGHLGLSSLAAGDFNGDHQLDLVLADEFTSSAIVLLNTGVVSFSPTTPLSFPAQLVGTTSTSQSVTLTNAGVTTLTISSITETSKQFNMTTTCGSSVAPGENCSFTVSFQPQSKGGQSGIISIRDSASTKPQVIELTGVGTVVSVSPSTLNFGSQKVGTKSKPQAVTVTNTGSTALNFTSIQISDNSEFTQTNNCGTQIAAGASCKIAVTFAPFQNGTQSGHLTITDDGGGSPQVVPLTGTGT